MAAPHRHSFLHLLLLLLFLGCASSCPSSPFSCGNFTADIKPPFTTSTSKPLCEGLHLIKCNATTPIIQFKSQGPWYPLRNISYSENSLIVQDQQVGDPSWGSGCNFLYDAVSPVPLSNISHLAQMLITEEFFFNCTMVEHDFSHEFLLQLRRSNPCRDYNFYYTSKLDDQTLRVLPTSCSARVPPLFEWKLSFREEDGGLRLLSAGFSHQLELRHDCFNCQAIGASCSINGAQSGAVCGPGSNSSSHKKIAIGVTAGLVGFLFACLFLVIYLYNQRKYQHSTIFPKKKPNNAQSIEAILEKYGTLAPRRYTYSDVRKMTKSFSIKLGQGGYGTVFKGNLIDGHPVAVKVLIESKDDGEEFVNEVASIGRTSHVNIVSLLGFCLEGTKRALIYDFMSNGSLDRYIYTDRSNIKIPLGWEKLYDITLGIAHGLEYLHRGCNTRIVHLDIKPHNILLDEEFCPKISDFGLAKLCLEKNSKISLVGTRGTVGYIAPEVFSRNFGVVSSKSDVYSYGMMVLEMVGGRKSIDAEAENTSEIDYPHWIYEHLNHEGDLETWGVTEETEEIARKMMLVGLWCIQTLPGDRPSMSKVVDMLEGCCEGLQMPPKPYLSSPVRSTNDSSTISIS